MKEEFESALEEPASVQVVEVEEPVELPPPTNNDFESDDWEPYAPKAGNVPVAKGETQETAIKPGGWHSYGYPDTGKEAPSDTPKPEEEEAVKADMALKSPTDPPEGVACQSGHNVPHDTAERLQQAVDAIEWLSKQIRNLPPKTKEILRLRRDRLKELIQILK